MRLLIYGHSHDEHALAVARALVADGHDCAIFNSDDFPVGSTISIDPAAGDWRLRGAMIDRDAQDFDVVWNRRNKPAASMPGLHPDDRAVAQHECTVFLRELRLSVPRDGQIWVNKERRQRAIAAKPAQLGLAHGVGLAIPRTLVSNDPARVRAFVGEADSAIVKALDRIGWEDDEGEVVLPTTIITSDDCDDDVSIRACPMIYQHRVAKAYELRVVMFGDDLLAVRLDSQSVESARVDWRAAKPNSFDIAEVRLADDLVAKLRAFARRADVVHGSFDLAVTPQGEAIFFEFNAQGQSLWIEDWNPRIRVLDRLAAFMASPTRCFRYDGVQRHSFADYLAFEQDGAAANAAATPAVRRPPAGGRPRA